MNVVAIIQARMGSTRLPGKVMISLDGVPVIQHVVRRTAASDVDSVVVAATEKTRDDIIELHANREGAEVFRGDEVDVLGRLYDAAAVTDADFVARVTADNPLLSPKALDAAIRVARSEDVDYVSNKIDRTFPSGLDVEVFTFDSFERVHRDAQDPYYREHVTPFYRDSDQFETSNLSSTSVFDAAYMQDRTDLRLTLDTPSDFVLMEAAYDNVEFDEILDVRDAVEYIDDNDLASTNTDQSSSTNSTSE